MSFWLPERSPIQADKFQIEATPACCVGPPERQFFMGGVAMAAAVEAAEVATGKPLLWATIQFISHGMLGDVVEIDIDEHGGGKSIAQIGVTNKVADRTLQHMSAALGARQGHEDQVFAVMPDVPPPEACQLKTDNAYAQTGNMLTQFERRLVAESSEEGTELAWIRPVFETKLSAGLLAMISDFFLGAHKRTRGGISLDNTFRMHALKETEWVFCHTRLTAIVNGAVHGVQYQFADDGTLLSSSSQTGLLPKIPNP